MLFLDVSRLDLNQHYVGRGNTTSPQEFHENNICRDVLPRIKNPIRTPRETFNPSKDIRDG